MSGIHPVSAALLGGFCVLVVLGGAAAAITALRRWRRERALAEVDPTIDLSYFHAATRAFNEAVRQLALERAAQSDHDIDLVGETEPAPPSIPDRAAHRWDPSLRPRSRAG